MHLCYLKSKKYTMFYLNTSTDTQNYLEYAFIGVSPEFTYDCSCEPCQPKFKAQKTLLTLPCSKTKWCFLQPRFCLMIQDEEYNFTVNKIWNQPEWIKLISHIISVLAVIVCFQLRLNIFEEHLQLPYFKRQ